MNFRLYPEERHFWSFSDYATVMNITAMLSARTVLEFGPGSSTLSLLEGGASKIDCCEDDPDWFSVYVERLQQRFPHRVTMHSYVWSDPLNVPVVDERRYDLALVDGPFGTERRPAVIAYALRRASNVLVPTEDYKTAGPVLRPVILALAKAANRAVRFFETGPLSGGFALVEPC